MRRVSTVLLGAAGVLRWAGQALALLPKREKEGSFLQAAIVFVLVISETALAHAQTFEGLGFPSAQSVESSAYGVSADGSVVAANSRTNGANEAFLWTAATGWVGLGFAPGRQSSGANAISADGSVVVGFGGEAIRWSAATGMVGLGFLPGGNASDALGVNSNGSVVVGYSNGVGTSSEAFRWTATSGMVGLGNLTVPERQPSIGNKC